MEWAGLAEAAPRGGARGRIAPTPTGLLHIGHGATFLTAARRARERGGELVLRMEDIDRARCRAEFAEAALEDLRWLGIEWGEGPDKGGRCAPYEQSLRMEFYLAAWRWLRDAGVIYPSAASRREIALAAGAPHGEEGAEPVFPAALRPPPGTGRDAAAPGGCNWRFRVPDGRAVVFRDALAGRREYVAGRDFGDFLVWRRDGGPSYELAVVVDDILMGITEVVRGEDLLLSTARQILVYEALGAAAPGFAHTPLVRDESGRRLAKRAGNGLTLRWLRLAGAAPERLFVCRGGVFFPELREIGRVAAGAGWPGTSGVRMGG